MDGIRAWTAVAGPGFPVSGGPSRWGAPTSNAGTFQQKHMQKLNNWILLGGAPVVPPGSANGLNSLKVSVA